MADASYYLAQFEKLSRQFNKVTEDRPRPSVILAVRYLDTYVDSAWAIRGAAADVHQFQRLAVRAALDLFNWSEGANAWLDEITRRGLGVETKGDADHKRITIADCIRSSILLCDQFARQQQDQVRTPRPAVTLQEAAKLLRVSPRTIARWQKGGKIRTVKVARVRRVPRDEIDRLLAGGDYPKTRA